MNGPNPDDDGTDPDDTGPEIPDLGPTKGWIAPDDRLWRHPSELPGSSPTLTGTRQTHPSSRWLPAAAACVVGLLVVGGIVLATTGSSSQHPDNTSEPGHVTFPTIEPGASPHISAAAAWKQALTVRPSMVAIQAIHTSGTVTGTAVVIETGGYAITTDALVANASSVTSINSTNGSHQPVTVVATDPNSNLAVIRVAGSPTVATFDDVSTQPGRTMVAVALQPATHPGDGPSTEVYAGIVRTTGTAVDADQTTSTLAATMVAMPIDKGEEGCPLLDASGNVAGLMDTAMVSHGVQESVFLPSDLVEGVAHQLISSGSVQHGWLGIDASDASPPSPPATIVSTHTTLPSDGSGALVDSEEAGGPAVQAGIKVGDTIVAIGNASVTSLADLRDRLYADPPGTTIDITYLRNQVEESTTAVLASK